MKALVCGSGDLTDGDFVFRELDRIDAERRITLVVEGGQRTYDVGRRTVGGADFHAHRWAVERARMTERSTVGWTAADGAARPDVVIAFPGGEGTRDCVRQAMASGVPVVLIRS